MAFLLLSVFFPCILGKVDRPTISNGFVVNFDSDKDQLDKSFVALEVLECLPGETVNITCSSKFDKTTLSSTKASFFINYGAAPSYNASGTDWLGSSAGEQTVTRTFQRGYHYIGLYPDCGTTGCVDGSAGVQLSCWAMNGTDWIPPQLVNNRRTGVYNVKKDGWMYFWFVVEPQDLQDNGLFIFFLSVTLASGHKSTTRVFVNKAEHGYPNSTDGNDYPSDAPGNTGDWTFSNTVLAGVGKYYGGVLVLNVDDDTLEGTTTTAGVTVKAGYNKAPDSASYHLLPTTFTIFFLLLSVFIHLL
jgi:hypothetical protein